MVKKKNIITEEHAAFLFPACKCNHLSGYWTVGWGKAGNLEASLWDLDDCNSLLFFSR